MVRIALLIVFALLGARHALAEIPQFAAQCPLGVRVDADANGTVRINGDIAEVRIFNNNYYEARRGPVTFSISRDAGSRNVQVTFTGPGAVNGVCQVLFAGNGSGGGGGNQPGFPPRPGGGGGAPNPDFAAQMSRVAGLSRGDVLNVRSGPGPGFRTIGALANGDLVRNLGCRNEGPGRWCEIQMMTDLRERGWVNARFLTPAGAPAVRPPDRNRTVRVRFEPGRLATDIVDRLPAGATVSFVLNARNRQFLRFNITGNNSGLSYRILNPDRSVLNGLMPAGREFGGQLRQTGDHIIEVRNNSGSLQQYRAVFVIR